MFLPQPRVKISIMGSLRDREVACSASDRQGSNFESCVWRTVSFQSSHHPQEVLLAQFSLYVHKGGLKPDSFHLEDVRCNKQDIYLTSLDATHEEADPRVIQHCNMSMPSIIDVVTNVGLLTQLCSFSCFKSEQLPMTSHAFGLHTDLYQHVC